MHFSAASALIIAITLFYLIQDTVASPLSSRDKLPDGLDGQLCFDPGLPGTCFFAYYTFPRGKPTGLNYYFYQHYCGSAENDLSSNYINFTPPNTNAVLGTFWPYMMYVIWTNQGETMSMTYAGKWYSNAENLKCGKVTPIENISGADAEYSCTVAFAC